VRVRELYSRLADSIDATVVTGNFPGARDETVRGVTYRRVGAKSPYWFSRITYAASANRILRNEKYDAALFDFSSYTPLFLPRGRSTGVVVHHITSPTAERRWGKILTRGIAGLERSMISRAGRISATSDAARDAATTIAPTTPLHMVSAGVAPSLFTLERHPESFLLYFGRLDIYHKGIDTLLEAVAIVSRSKPDILLKIAGRGSSSDEIAALAKKSGIERNVQVLGAVDDSERDRLFSTAVMQVMPSRFEGFGLAAAEAMAAGVPLIASNAGSLPEVVDAPRGGVVVPPDDPEALADAIARMLDDEAMRQSLSSSARESARRFDWDRVASDHLAFIRAVAGQ
jgi:glycosyltransferase involved in cell wall biosynthesis